MASNNYSGNIYKNKNVINVITNHQYGLQPDLSYQSDVIKLKVRQLRRSLDEFEIDPDLSYCKILRNADNGCLIGVWQKNMDPASRHSYTYHMKFEYNEPLSNYKEDISCPIVSNLSCLGPYFKRMDVTDACERTVGEHSYLLYVGNTAVSGGRVVLNINNNESNSEDCFPEVVWHLPKCLWSCASSSQGLYAAGTENSFIIFNHTCDLVNELNLHTNVLALDFNKDGNLLYCGTKDRLFICDTRQNVGTNEGRHQCISVSQNGTKEIKVLSDENTVIVTETNGTLWKVRVIIKYIRF